MTEAVFSYGTLRDESVQLALFGRKFDTVPDVLVGFRLAPMQITDPQSVKISGKDMHTILRPVEGEGDAILGQVLRMTQSELEQADQYEPKEVKRIWVKLQSGAQAWVYILP